MRTSAFFCAATRLMLLLPLGSTFFASTGAKAHVQDTTRVKAQVQDTVWGRPTDTTATDYLIDARQGTSQARKTFNQGASVRIVLTDVNPFLFNYRLETKGQTVAEASPASFFNVAFGLEIPKATESRALVLNLMNSFTATKDSATLASCTPTAYSEAQESAKRVSVLAVIFTERVRGPAESLTTAIAEPTQRYRSGLSKARANHGTTRQIREGAVTASAALVNISDAYQRADEALKPNVDMYTKDVRELRQKLDDLIEMHPACLPLRESRILSGLLIADTLWAKNLVATVAAKRSEAQLVSGILSTIANDPRRFYVIIELPRFRGPTDVEITVSRQPLTVNITPVTTGTGDQVKPVKFDTVGRHHLNVGGRGRFSSAAGITYSPLPERTYSAVQRSLPNLDGTTSTAAFVVRTKNAPKRLSPMLFLNSNVCDWWFFPDCTDVPADVSFHAVLGVTPKALALNRFDYFLGGGIGVFGERLYLNAGLFIAPLEKLNGGVATQGQLPPGQTTVSTRTTLAQHFGAAITYRVAPW